METGIGLSAAIESPLDHRERMDEVPSPEDRLMLLSMISESGGHDSHDLQV